MLKKLSLVEPTPLMEAEAVSRSLGRAVLVKRDDLAHPRYGGNKVRKLEWLLADALSRGATDVLTVGAAGSHHALATALFGRARGLDVEAVLTPQPYSPHAEQTLRASLAAATALHPVKSVADAALTLARRAWTLRRAGRRPYVIPPGGSTPLGARGFVDAFDELATQLSERAGPRPAQVICPLGSGGTLAGLSAGAALLGLGVEVWGVRVAPAPFGSPWMVSALATGALRDAGHRVTVSPRELRIFDGALGGGYGVPTAQGERMTELFARDGLRLDPTYSAKAAAGMFALARTLPPRVPVVFWLTLSSVTPPGRSSGPLPPALSALWTER